MKNCPSCGNSTDNSMKFCQSCGAKVTDSNIQSKISSEQNVTNSSVTEKPVKNDATNKEKPASTPVKKPMSLLTKLLMTLVILLVVTIGVAHYVLQKSYDPWSVLAKMDEAYASEDFEQFSSFFTFPENTYTEAEAFWHYVDSQNWDRKIYSALEDAIEEFEDGETKPIAITDADNNRLITVSQSKAFGIYKNYTYDITPVELSIDTSAPLLTVAYGSNSVEIKQDENKKIGKFAPGIYPLTVTIQDDFGTISETIDTEIYNQGQKKSDLYFNYEDKMVHFISDYDDAILFVNGKSTNKKASDLVSYTLSTDGKTEIYAEVTKDGKVIQSEKVKIDSSDVHIPFKDVQEKKRKQEEINAALQNHGDNINYFYSDFRYSFETALNYIDTSYVASYFEAGSKLQKDYMAFIVDHSSFGYYEYNYVTNNITEMNAIDGNTIQFKTNETFYFYSSDDGDWHYDRDKLYTVKINNGDYVITNIEDIGTPNKTQL